jgi:adenylyltransferase/sulfurtransferase
LAKAKVLVVGAGALGNEVVKNLVLVGVGHVEVCDMDTIENSNLARCVFFRPSDVGQYKAEVLAKRAQELYDEVKVVAHRLPIQRLGAAYLNSFDLVIGALDNREARAWVNQACRKLGLHWIDGAIEGLRGLARMFAPEGACYACTLTDADYRQMSHRKSCALLSPADLLEGKTPTNVSTASIIAAVEVQEAVKYLVGHNAALSLVGKAWMFTGDVMDAYISRYQEDEYCMAHDRYENIMDSDASNIAELLAANFKSSDVVAIDFEEELIELSACAKCGEGENFTSFRSAVPLGRGRCACGSDFPGTMAGSIEPSHPAINLSFAELGAAESELITVRTESERYHFAIKGTK